MTLAARFSIGGIALLIASAPLSAALCLTAEYAVYFAPGRWDVDNPRAETTIRAVVAEIRGRHATRIVVQAFTDTVGNATLNQAVSQRRADAVRRALLAEGIQSTAMGFGESQLGIPTPDNTPEQRNRRAVVYIVS